MARATGGNTITKDANYYYHTFTANGTFTPDSSLKEVEVMLVGGGGGGGSRVAGAGGGGGYVYNPSVAVSPGTGYSITIGTSGTAGVNNVAGGSGGNSTGFSLTATGGGGGGGADAPTGKNGGCGGGGRGSTGAGGGTGSQGYNGGAGSTVATALGGGGGGGAGAVGSAGSGTVGGDGGAGILGMTGKYYAGGGGGGCQYGYTAGSGGNGGGGAGNSAGTATSGTANTGGGGGGGGNNGATNYNGGAGGTGIVVVRYPVSSIKRIMPEINANEFYNNPLLSDASLKAYYRFEGNSNDYKNAYNGTDTAITYGTNYGKFNQGALFNGTSSVIKASQYNMGNWTIGAWIKPNGTQSVYASIISDKYPTKIQYVLFFSAVGNTLDLAAGFYNAGWYQTPYYTIKNSVWQYVVGSYDGSTIKLYVNGFLVESFATTATAATDGYETRIGQRWDNANHFNGSMDELVVFSRALTADEIKSIYNSTYKKFMGISNEPVEFNSAALLNDSNTISYWRMEGDSTDAKGYSTRTDTGMAYGSSYGRFTQGALFNGSTSHIQVAANARLNALGAASGAGSNYSVGCWFKTTTTKDQSLSEKWTGGYPWAIRGPIGTATTGYGYISFGIYNGTSGWGCIDQSRNWADGRWHFMVAVRDKDAGKARLYMDGNLSDEVTDGSGSVSNTGVVEIGCRNGPGNYFNGQMDEFFIMDRALTTGEVASLYNSNKKIMGISNT